MAADYRIRWRPRGQLSVETKSESTVKRTYRSGRYTAGVRIAVAASLVAGCAPVTTLEGERLRVRSDAFANYVEQVFREQNRVASELAFAIEDAADTERVDVLEAAEEALLDACAELNQLAAARRDGERLGLFRSLGAARGAPDCECAAAAASRVIAETP